jgi:hypothetical protein
MTRGKAKRGFAVRGRLGEVGGNQRAKQDKRMAGNQRTYQSKLGEGRARGVLGG